LWNLAYQQEKNDEKNQRHTLEQLKSQYPNAKATLTLIRQSCQPTEHFSFSSFSPLIICDFLSHLSHQDRASFLQAKAVAERYEKAEAQLKYLKDRNSWLEQQVKQLRYEVMPLLRPFHWEDDAGGDQGLNRFVSWWDLTRINRKDMVASLIFGVRVSLSVGLLAIGLALLIGIPIGAVAGYYGGKLDLFVYRLIEIWESMPTFFMLLMIVDFLQSKSIFLIIGVIGLFGWTGFSRFVRGEFFRQKQLLYVEACHALGYPDKRIIFSHLLPNAIPPLLTLVPFAVMGAITSEAALSFLGLGEEGSNSWGVLMDEGRSAFPSESYLLWPPAILLTILLVAIALVGDSLRDALDPKLHTI
jgi:peptide/nickel transport system permease protein